MEAAPTITTLVSPDFKIATINRTAEDLGIMGLHMVDSPMASREAIAVRLDAASVERTEQTEAIKRLADQVAALTGDIKTLREETSSLRERVESSERARTEGFEPLREEMAASLAEEIKKVKAIIPRRGSLWPQVEAFALRTGQW